MCYSLPSDVAHKLIQCLIYSIYLWHARFIISTFIQSRRGYSINPLICANIIDIPLSPFWIHCNKSTFILYHIQGHYWLQAQFILSYYKNSCSLSTVIKLHLSTVFSCMEYVPLEFWRKLCGFWMAIIHLAWRAQNSQNSELFSYYIRLHSF